MLARVASLLVFLLGISVGSLEAGTFSGRITKISTDGAQVTVFSTSQEKEQVFALTGRNLRITIDSKPGKSEQLQVGNLVTIITNAGGQAERVIARSASAAVTEKTSPAKTSASTQPTPSKPAPGASDNQTASRPANNTPSEPWPGFLGPDLQNRSADKNLLATWPVDGPGLLWTARNLGEGYSSVSIAEGKLFSMGTRQGREVVLAFDLQTGRELWAVNSGAVFNDNMGNGPRSTPTYENGRLYTLGASGDLTAINAANGTILWQQNILSQHAARNIVWGISESPLIDGDKLICTPGGNGATMVALNKNNGQTIWQAAIPGNPQAGYSTAIVTDLNGVRQYVNFCHNGLFSVDARTGQPLWGDNNAANSTANCSSPIAIGNNSIFYASGYGTGGALLRFAGRAAKPSLAYKTEKMKNHHGGMVELNGFLYGANENILTCLNVQTGEITWQDRLGGNGKGAITYADGHLYFRSENGPMYLIEADPNNFVVKGQFNQPERSNRPSWARPVVADGKLFLRDQDILLCYQVKQ